MYIKYNKLETEAHHYHKSRAYDSTIYMNYMCALYALSMSDYSLNATLTFKLL